MDYFKLLSSICKHNKYYTWYVDICQTKRAKSKDLYLEQHHIIPKSFGLGGKKDKANLVYLTAREHYIAHKLLTKILLSAEHTKKMRYALWYLTVRKVGYVPNSRSYSIIRTQIAEENKKRVDSLETRRKKARPGKLNGMWGQTHTDKVKEEQGRRAIKNFKDKTYEEIHGVERATQLKQDRSIKLKTYFKNNPGCRDGKNNAHAKSYKFIDPAGATHIIHGEFKTFCRAHKLEFGAAINCAKGRRASYKGWTIHYC